MTGPADAPQPPVDDARAALLERARSIDGAPAAGDAPQAVDEAPVDAVAEVRGLLELLRAIGGGLSPVVERVWTDAVLDRTAPALAAVLQKHGMTGSLFDRWGVELALLATIAPPTLATIKGIQEERAEAAKPRAKLPQPAAAPAAPPPVSPFAMQPIPDGPQG